MVAKLSIIGAYFVEFVIAYLFFLQQGAEQQKRWVRWCMGLGLFAVGAACYFVFQSLWVNAILDFVITLLFAHFAFRISWQRAAFGSALLHVLNVIGDLLVMAISGRIMPSDLSVLLAQSRYTVIFLVISKTLYFIVTVFLARLTRKSETSVHIPAVFYLYPLTGSLTMASFGCVCAAYNITGTYLILAIVLSVLMLLSTFLLFLTYQNNVRRENQLHSLERQNEKEQTDKTYYDILEKQNADLMIYAHDTKKHLSAIRELNQNPQIEAYLSTMTERLREYSSIGHSGNRMLDIICNKYATECSSKNIALEMDVHLANFCYMDDFDLVTLFGNILDNAVEAAGNSVEKRILLYTDHCNTYDVIVLTNSCDEAPVSNGHTLTTTKKNPALHGLGLQSLSRVLAKYSGDYDWEYNARTREFTMTVMVLLPKTEQASAM